MPQDKKSLLDTFLNKQDDCDRPACEDTVNALSSALSRLNKKKEDDSQSKAMVGSRSTASATECPPTKDVIGSSSWTLLHSMVRILSWCILHIIMHTVKNKNTLIFCIICHFPWNMKQL